jgi:hypothetical protein
MSEVRVTTSLKARDVARVSFRLLVLHPVSLSLMAAGPLLLGLGAVSASGAVTSLGTTMSWLMLMVPGYGLLVSTYTAYRPGAAEVYQPAEWSFAEAGVGVSQPGRDARAEWSEFTGWRSVAGCLLLHTAPARYAVIPWRDVPEDGRAGLEALLGEHLGKRKR